jgi:hypothetical protein
MFWRAGDVLRVSCPFDTAVVTAVGRDHVSLRWPWWEIDPDVVGVAWNGDVAVSRTDPDELFTTDPPAGDLRPGGTCRVGVLPRIVHVLEVRRGGEPEETGWLPRPTEILTVLPGGVASDPYAEFEGLDIEVDGGVPFTFEPVFRPYAFLEAGDDVADAAGRAWHFGGPFAWAAFDGVAGAPRWPLFLLAGAADAATVAAATAGGSHDDEVDRWRRAAGLSG